MTALTPCLPLSGQLPASYGYFDTSILYMLTTEIPASFLINPSHGPVFLWGITSLLAHCRQKNILAENVSHETARIMHDGVNLMDFFTTQADPIQIVAAKLMKHDLRMGHLNINAPAEDDATPAADYMRALYQAAKSDGNDFEVRNKIIIADRKWKAAHEHSGDEGARQLIARAPDDDLPIFYYAEDHDARDRAEFVRGDTRVQGIRFLQLLVCLDACGLLEKMGIKKDAVRKIPALVRRHLEKHKLEAHFSERGLDDCGRLISSLKKGSIPQQYTPKPRTTITPAQQASQQPSRPQVDPMQRKRRVLTLAGVQSEPKEP